jgi:signal transduction histidine kinase
MESQRSLLGLLRRRPLPVAGILAIGLATIQVVIDWFTWIELNEAIVYPLPLVLAAMARGRRMLWILTGVLIATIFAVYSFQIAPGEFSLREPFFINRVLAAVTVLLTAIMLHVWTLALDKLDEQDRRLEAQNERLDAANRELQRLYEEIRRQNQALEQRRKAAEEASGRKTRLLASVSHDIRSPLTAINLTADVIRRAAHDAALGADVPALAQRVQANAAALAELVSDLLDMSALESGETQFNESEFGVKVMLDDVCRRLGPLAHAKNLDLAADSRIPDVHIRADWVKLTRVLSNLVTNAIKFTQRGGVTLTAELIGEQAVIRVRDTGIGIPADSLERIFDEFTQLRNPRRESGQGWGLGLAICRRLAESMGGAVTVESELNRGSVFSVRLPASCIVQRSEACSDQAQGAETDRNRQER